MTEHPFVAALLLCAGLACHPGAETASPASEAAEFDGLVDRFAAMETDEFTPYTCRELDTAAARLQGGELHDRALYLRAELALRCGSEQTWLDRHELLAHRDYLPSLTRLCDDAVARRDWDRAQAMLDRLDAKLEDTAAAHRLGEVRVQVAHGRWVDEGDAEAFTWLERRARRAIVSDPRDLEARAELIRLYVEKAEIEQAPETLLLAQATEREARAVEAHADDPSPALELAAGLLRDAEGDRPAAVAAWERALELNNALVEPHLWLGLAALDRRDFAEARAQLAAYLEVHPDHAEARRALDFARAQLPR